jgi:hypothetical protein
MSLGITAFSALASLLLQGRDAFAQPAVKDKEPDAQKTGADSNLPVYTTENEIVAAFVQRGQFDITYLEMSKDVAEIEQLLLTADQRGEIAWVEHNDWSGCYRLLQQRIDTAPERSDVHLLFGYNHASDAQYAFLNELLTEGADHQKLGGITAVALETFGGAEVRGDDASAMLDAWDEEADLKEQKNKTLSVTEGGTQDLINYYLRTGDTRAYDWLERYEYYVLGDYMPLKDDVMYTLSIAYAEKYAVLATDVPIAKKREMGGLPAAWRYKSREMYAADSVAQAGTAGKDVFFYIYGALHVEETGLPQMIRYNDPQATIISVLLSGGNFEFNQAIEELGKKDPKWTTQPFALTLAGYREADVVLHFPDARSNFPYNPNASRSGLMEFAVR